MAVSVETEPEFEVGRPYTLFRNSQVVSSMYDVAPDGRSFRIQKNLRAERGTRHLQLFRELKRLAPADN